MNLEKERELFEAWYLQHYYTRNGLTPNIDVFKKYHDGDDWVYLYDPAFRSWTVWLASASREGYKMVPVDSLRIIMECVSCDDLNLYDGVMDAYDDIEKAMVGAVE